MPRVRQRRLAPAVPVAAVALFFAIAAPARGGTLARSAAEVTLNGAGDIEAAVRVRREGQAASPADIARDKEAVAARRKEGKRSLARWNRSSQFVAMSERPDSGLARTVEWRYRILAPIARVGTARVPLAMWPGPELAALLADSAQGLTHTRGLDLAATLHVTWAERATVDSLPVPLRFANAFGEAACEARRIDHGLEWSWSCRVNVGLACGPGEREALDRLLAAARSALAQSVVVSLNGGEVHAPFPSRSPPFGHTHGGGGGHH